MAKYDLNALRQSGRDQGDPKAVKPTLAPQGKYNLGALRAAESTFSQIAKPAGAPRERGFLGNTGDLLSTTAAGAVSGLGLGVEELGQVSRQLPPGIRPSPIGSELTSAAGQWLQQKADQFNQWALDDVTKEKVGRAQIKGTLWNPSTWDFGEDPTLMGLGVQVAHTLGQMTPIIAAGLATGGLAAPAAFGGLQSGASGRDYVEQEVQQAYDSGIIHTAFPRWKELKDEGLTDVAALRQLKQEAGDVGSLLTTPIGAIGGAITSRIVQGLTGRSLVKGALLGAAEEGAQEVAESSAAKAAVDVQSNIPQNYGEGTLADFVLGAIAGGSVGGVANLGRGGSDPEEFTEADLGVAPLPDTVENLPSVDAQNTQKTRQSAPIATPDTQTEVEPNVPEFSTRPEWAADLEASLNLEFEQPKRGDRPGGVFRSIHDSGRVIAKEFENPLKAEEYQTISDLFYTTSPVTTFLSEPVPDHLNVRIQQYDPPGEEQFEVFNPEDPEQKAKAQLGFVSNIILGITDPFGRGFENVGWYPQGVGNVHQFSMNEILTDETNIVEIIDKILATDEGATIYRDLTFDQVRFQVSELLSDIGGSPTFMSRIFGANLPPQKKYELYRTIYKRIKGLRDFYSKGQTIQIPSPATFNSMLEGVEEDPTSLDELLEDGRYASHDTILLDPTKDPYQDPSILGLLTNPDYKRWAKGNRLWWDPELGRLSDEDQREGLLPPVLYIRPWLDLREGGQVKTGVPIVLEVSADPDVLSPVTVNFSNPIIIDGRGRDPEQLLKEADFEARASGADAVVIENFEGTDGSSRTIVAGIQASGKNIKSPWALNFDPKDRDILNSVAGKTVRVHRLHPGHQVMFEEELERVGLKGMVNVKLFPFGTKGRSVASFGRDAHGLYIALATQLPSIYGVRGEFRHEVIHALKHLGFFDTPKGRRYWKILTNHVRSQGISDHVRENYIPENYVEEEVALLAARWTAGELDAETSIGRVAKAIVDFVTALGNFFRGRGFLTADRAFQEIFGGQMAPWMAATQDKFTDAQEQELHASKLAVQKYGGRFNPQHADYYSRLSKYGETVLQLANKNLHIPWLQNYVQRARLWHSSKTKTLHAANETVGKWTGLGRTQATALSRVLIEVDQMQYRTQDEIDKGVVRHPTAAELQAIFAKNGLNNQGISVYVQVRKDFLSLLDRMETTILDSVDKNLGNVIGPSGLGSSVQADLTKAQIKKEFAEIRKAPYFPHSRFGTYTVVVTDSSGKRVHVEAFENERERDRAVEVTRRKFPHASGFNVARGKFSEEQKVYQGLPYSLLVAMKEKLKLNRTQEKALDELINSALPAQSFKNHFIKRDNTPGYSEDALRAYAEYFWHGANHLARIEFAPAMEEDILEADKDVITIQGTHGGDATKRSQLRDFIKSHLDELQNPTPDWASLRSVGFLWWLGFNVKSAVLNLTQVPMVTYSHLAARFGDPKTLGALSLQTATIQRAYRNPKKAKTPEERRILNLVARGIDEGFLDESFAAELAGLAEGANLTQSLAKSRLRSFGTNFLHWSGYMFQATEKLNRRITFTTALALAKSNRGSAYHKEIEHKFSLEIKRMIKDGWGFEDARDFYLAKDAVESTQFNYSAWARPRVMRGRRSAFFTFFMFTQNMLWFIANNPGRLRYLLILLIFAGVMGLPGAEDLEALASAVGTRIMGRSWSPEKELRRLVMENFDEHGITPDLFLHGISRHGFGLPMLGDLTGLPLPAVDMSGNIGMGSPIPIISPLIQVGAEATKPGAMDFQDALGRFTAEGVGATLGIVPKVLEAAFDTRLEVVDPKRWEKAAPASLSNASKAMRFWAEGRERSRSGATVLEFDRNNPAHVAEVAAQALGFYPTRRAEAWDRILALGEVERFWVGRRGAIYQQWEAARDSGDPQDMKNMLAAVNRFNKQVPYPELRVSRKKLNESYKARKRSEKTQEALQPNFKGARRAVREELELHPSTFEEKIPRGN